MEGIASLLLIDSLSLSSLSINAHNLSATHLADFLNISKSINYQPDGKPRVVGFLHRDCGQGSTRDIYNRNDGKYAPRFLLCRDTLKVEAELIFNCAIPPEIAGLRVQGNRIYLEAEPYEERNHFLYPGHSTERAIASCDCVFCSTFILTGIKDPENYTFIINGEEAKKPIKLIKVR